MPNEIKVKPNNSEFGPHGPEDQSDNYHRFKRCLREARKALSHANVYLYQDGPAYKTITEAAELLKSLKFEDDEN